MNSIEHNTSAATDDLPIDRRTLLKTVGLGTAVGLSGCQGLDIEGIGRSADEHVPFDVWKEVRTALWRSPDHLPARATSAAFCTASLDQH